MLVKKDPTFFTTFSKGISRFAGRPFSFAAAEFLILAWALLGPMFDFSDAWQLTVNTATTIITFLMVFLIQATQNRDAEAIQIKLDEIIRAHKHARNELLDTEEMEESDLVELRQHYLKLAERARQRHSGSHDEAHVPDLAEKGSGEQRAAD